MKKILALLLLSPLVGGEELNLICNGTASIEKPSVVQSKTTTNPGMPPVQTQTIIPNAKKKSFESAIYLNLDLKNESGDIELPKSLRRKGAKVTKQDLTELTINENTIEARVKWNLLERGKILIDRRTGTINYTTTSPVSFNGSCSKFELKNKF